MNKITIELTEIIKKIEALHPEDPRIYNYWDELTEVLSANEAETVCFLDHLNDKEIANHISSVFYDTACRLKSAKFITSIEKLVKRFPDLLLVHMVNAAKEAMDEIEEE